MSTSLRRFAPALAALAVAALVLGVALVLRADGDAPEPTAGSSGATATSPGDPQPLRITDPPTVVPGGDVEPRWQLTGDLPGGTPDDVTLQRVSGVDQAAAQRLAAALGLAGDGRTEGSSTVWASGEASLQVAGDGAWTYTASGCQVLGGTQAGASGSVRCGAPSEPVQPAGPAADTSVAERVLDAAGVGGKRVVRPVRGASTATVLVEPPVAGRATGGLTTLLRVTGSTVTYGTGWLPTWEQGAAYPVVDARTAWEQVRHTLLPQTLVACSVPDAPGTDPLLCGGPVEVTGTRLGRTVAHLAGGDTVLVPAWLFTVKGRDQAFPVIAVPERLLRRSGGVTVSPPAPVPSTTRRGPGKDPVSPEPANPGSRFSHVAPSGDGALSVTFTGGVDTCYRYQVVVDDGPDRVRLSLTQKVTSDQACIDLAQVYERTVPLPSPLAGRPVVDAESGAVLLAGSGR